MKSFLEYIMLNYTWFLGGAIIILLAIIGSYADKTNFGQGKTKENENEKLRELELEKLKLQQQLEEAQRVQEVIVEEIPTVENQIEEIPAVENHVEETPAVENHVEEITEVVVETSQLNKNNEMTKKEDPTLESYEEKYAKFDKVFDALLPKKGFDDGDLLDEIESISLDRTQKIDITEIPNLAAVDLPQIKSLDPVDEDIWKF